MARLEGLTLSAPSIEVPVSLDWKGPDYLIMPDGDDFLSLSFLSP